MIDENTAMDLLALETEATEHLEVWKHAYWQFWTILLEIRDTGVWEQSNQDTWEGYLESRWLPQLQVGYNRIRQIQAAYPVMRLIEDVTGVTLNENQIRTIKQIVPESDRHLLPEIVSTVFSHTNTPAARHIKETYGVIKERIETNTVSIDGENHTLNLTTVAAKQAMLESDRRYNEHRTQGLQDAPVVVLQLGNQAYAVIQLPSDYPIALLTGYIAKVPKAVRKQAATASGEAVA
jgi:hypothetical protein